MATLPIDGKPRKVVMQAPKNGFFYVLDAANGKFISAETVSSMRELGQGHRPEHRASDL